MLETVQLFYVVIRATRRSTRLPGKGSIYTSQYFKTLSIGPAPGIKPPTSRSAIKRSNDCANPAAVMIENKRIFQICSRAITLALMAKHITWVMTFPFEFIARNLPVTRLRSLSMLVPKDWDSNNAVLEGNEIQLTIVCSQIKSNFC